MSAAGPADALGPPSADSSPVAGPGLGLAQVLVRLKLRLTVNRARSTRNGRLGLGLAVLVALGVAAAGLVAAVALGAGADAHDRRAVLVLAPTVLALAWTLLPLATFGADETLDPSRLVLYPVRRGPLVRALLLAAFVGPAPLAVVAVTVGVVVGFGGVSGLVVAVPAGVLALLLAVSASRLLATSLAAALSSRRSRDAAIVFGSVLAVGVQLVRFVRLPSLSDEAVDRILDVAQWLPTGLLGRAVLDARGGRWPVAALELLPAAALVPLLVRWWGRSLERALTVVTSGSTTARARRRAVDGRTPLLPGWLPFVPAEPWGAVTARDLRYSWRDPRRKAALLVRSLLAVGGPVWLVAQQDRPGSRAVLLAAGVGYLAVLGSFNQFGLDGGALWSDLVSGDRLRTLLVGKNASALVQVVPAVAVAAVILAAATGGWAYVPVALVVAVGAVGVGLGVADVVSIVVPFKVPEGRGAFGGGALGAGGGGGQGIATALTLLVATIVQNLLMLPIAIGTGLAAFVSPGWLVLVAPLAVAYGYGIWRGGLAVAVDRGWWREPELLAAVDPARSDRTRT